MCLLSFALLTRMIHGMVYDVCTYFVLLHELVVVMLLLVHVIRPSYQLRESLVRVVKPCTLLACAVCGKVYGRTSRFTKFFAYYHLPDCYISSDCKQ